MNHMIMFVKVFSLTTGVGLYVLYAVTQGSLIALVFMMAALIATIYTFLDYLP